MYFLIFSCFPEARKAVKRTPEVKFSYTELELILLLDFIGTVRVTFHAVSAKYFVIPARNISCWKAMIGGQRVMRIGDHLKKLRRVFLTDTWKLVQPFREDNSNINHRMGNERPTSSGSHPSTA